MNAISHCGGGGQLLQILPMQASVNTAMTTAHQRWITALMQMAGTVHTTNWQKS